METDQSNVPASYLYNVYPTPSLSFVTGKGSWLYDDKGDAYLDFMSGIAVNSFGHCYEPLVAALEKQARDLWHISNLYVFAGREKLAKLLCDNSFADKVFFCNSGLEAVECAIKTARRYNYVYRNKSDTTILTFENNFHGRSLATIAAGGREKHLEGFAPHMPGFMVIKAQESAVLDAIKSTEVGAILIEPIQGEGGIKMFSPEFLQFLRKLCTDLGILLIYDEIQCGMGRSGKLFAYQNIDNIEPDIMAIAKGLGGGFPVGACMARKDVAAAMDVGSHGSTFGGNPLAMTVATEVVNCLLEPGFLSYIEQMGELFVQGLGELQVKYPNYIEEICGCGLMLGLKLKLDIAQLRIKLQDNKLLVVGANNNIIRFLPPLNVKQQEIELALNIIDKSLAEY